MYGEYAYWCQDVKGEWDKLTLSEPMKLQGTEKKPCIIHAICSPHEDFEV